MQRVILALVALFVCAQAAEVCFPEVYTTDEATFDPSKHDVYGARNHFSFPLKKQRVDVDFIVQNDHPEKEKVVFYIDGHDKVWYEAIYVANTANCTKHTMTTPFERPCLSKNARHRGTIILGATLRTDNYIETFVDKQQEKIRLDILAVDNINVPVRMTVYDVNTKNFRVTEWWNFEERVAHDAFNMPGVCKQAKLTEASQESIELLQRHSVIAKF